MARKTKHNGGETNTCIVGSVLDTRGEELDQAVATIFRAPHSFTGEDVVEISVHGSRWVQHELIMSLINAGARMAKPVNFRGAHSPTDAWTSLKQKPWPIS